MIVVGYDGSPASQAATRWAADEAVRQHLPLRVVHAPARPIMPDPTGDALLLRLAVIHTVAESLLDHVWRQLRTDYPDLQIDVAAIIGDTTSVLLLEATNATVLVLGSRGPSRNGSTGSVVSHLTTQAACPVVVVPASWRPEPATQQPPRGRP